MTIDATVLDHFRTVFPAAPLSAGDAATFASMPLDSECGDDCKGAIDAAQAVIEHIRMAYGDYSKAERMVANLAATIAEVIGCYITG